VAGRWERGHPCPLGRRKARKLEWRDNSRLNLSARFRVLAHAAGKDARAPSVALTLFCHAKHIMVSTVRVTVEDVKG